MKHSSAFSMGVEIRVIYVKMALLTTDVKLCFWDNNSKDKAV